MFAVPTCFAARGIRASRIAAWSVACAMAVAACSGEEEGGGSSAAVDAGECASGRKWTGGNAESPLMHPGYDCIGCHTSMGEGPRFTVAGTVFADLNDGDDCFGVAGATVVVTGSDGNAVEMTTNEAGNFFTTQPVATPFTAKVVYQGKERAMLSQQTNGACATCHTATGANGAPGRILLPM